MKTAKATPNREVSEERARVVGLPRLPLELEEVPVLAGPEAPELARVEVWPVEEGTELLRVGRDA